MALSFHACGPRKAGSQRFIDLHLVVPQYQDITATHQVCDDIEEKIKDKYPGAQVLIHVEPCQESERIVGDVESGDSAKYYKKK